MNRIIFMMLTAAMLASCSDYLDQVPDDRQTIEEVFKKKNTTEQYLANIYSYIRDDGAQWADSPWTANSDELVTSWTQYGTYQINVGNWDKVNTPFSFWGDYYKGIRAATYFINHIDGNEELQQLNPELIVQYKAEARYLRAHFYFMLMRQYGPVVLVGDTELPVDAPSSGLQKLRSPFDACVDYVVAEMDLAAADLPLVSQTIDYGRITRGAVLALKSRLLLYAASPLYNGNTARSDFTNPDGTALISQTYSAEKWMRAADAAKAVIDLNVYALYNAGADPIATYRGILLEPWNSETILARKGNALAELDVHSNPRQAGGWCGMAPTQEIVDDYFMNDGLPIKDEPFAAGSPLYTETGFTGGIYNMYVNREPRFYASITYNKSKWDGGTLSAPTEINFEVNGPNSATGHPSDWSRTGYLLRKGISEITNAGSAGTGEKFERPLVLCRLGEIYLNYIEALNEIDPGHADILIYLNLIRHRAGIPEYGAGIPIPADQASMREAIHRERRIELAFESHRWFDIRRWNEPEKYTGHAMHGMDIYSSGDNFYKRVVAQDRTFRPAYYWFPIRQFEIDRASQIVQNPGW